MSQRRKQRSSYTR